ncbi:MAG: preprotein translocase subunit SecG [Burkholderiales bacterium]
MDFWFTLILVVDVIVALGIIGLVLLQHGKGADVGAAFGGGSSGSLFGATGSANFLSRTTAVLAVVFFLTTFVLAYLVTHKPKAGGGVMDTVKEQPQVPLQQVPLQQQVPTQQAPEAGKSAGGAKPKADEVPK